MKKSSRGDAKVIKRMLKKYKSPLVAGLCIVLVVYLLIQWREFYTYDNIVIRLEEVDKRDYHVFEREFGISLPETAVIEKVFSTRWHNSHTIVCISGIGNPINFINNNCVANVDVEKDTREMEDTDWLAYDTISTMHGDLSPKEVDIYHGVFAGDEERFVVYNVDGRTYVDITITSCTTEMDELLQWYRKQKRDVRSQ